MTPFDWHYPDLRVSDNNAHNLNVFLIEILRHDQIDSGEYQSSDRTRYRSITEFLNHDEVGRDEFDKLVDVFIWAQREQGILPSNFEIYQDDEVPIVVSRHVVRRMQRRHVPSLQPILGKRKDSDVDCSFGRSHNSSGLQSHS